ncbi:MAG: glycosyltransferase family 39 protein [Chloroflexota bacterium]
MRTQTDIRLVVIVLVGLVPRVWWQLTSHAVPVSDAGAYRAFALSLASGQGYAFGGYPTAWWVPGWPAFLAVLYRVAGSNDTVVYLANLALAAATILLTYALARHLFSEPAALVAAAIVSVFPALVLLPRFLLSENLALPLFLAVILLAVRLEHSRRALLAGLSIGLTCGVLVMVREQSLIVLIAIGVSWCARRRSMSPLAPRLAGLIVGALLVLAPWVVRNAVVVGIVGLSTSSTTNLLISFGPQTTGGYVTLDPASFGAFTIGHDEAGRARLARSELVAYVRAHPAILARFAPAKLMIYVLDESWPLWWDQDATGASSLDGRGRMLVLLAGYAVYLPALAFGAAGLARAGRRAPLVTAIVLLSIALQAMMFSNGRFHAVLEPVLAVYAAGWLVRSQRRANADRDCSPAVAGAMAVAEACAEG